MNTSDIMEEVVRNLRKDSKLVRLEKIFKSAQILHAYYVNVQEYEVRISSTRKAYAEGLDSALEPALRAFCRIRRVFLNNGTNIAKEGGRFTKKYSITPFRIY